MLAYGAARHLPWVSPVSDGKVGRIRGAFVLRYGTVKDGDNTISLNDAQPRGYRYFIGFQEKARMSANRHPAFLTSPIAIDMIEDLRQISACIAHSSAIARIWQHEISKLKRRVHYQKGGREIGVIRVPALHLDLLSLGNVSNRKTCLFLPLREIGDSKNHSALLTTDEAEHFILRMMRRDRGSNKISNGEGDRTTS
jgi:hypothetical protein